MSMTFKRTIPMLMVAFLALIMVFGYFFTPEIGKVASSEVNLWAMLVWCVSLVYGGTLSIRQNIYRIMRRSEMWQYNILMLISFVITFGLGLIGGTENFYFKWIADNILMGAWPAMLGTAGFFMISASYRAFRFRTVDASLLLITGILITLRNTPLAVSYFPGFATIGNWIMGVLATGGSRGLLIGMAIGILSMGVRTILGYEKMYLGAGD